MSPAKQLDALRAFAQEVIRSARESSEVVEIALKHGLIKQQTVTEPCGENCACFEVGFPTACYFDSNLLKGDAAPAEHTLTITVSTGEPYQATADVEFKFAPPVKVDGPPTTVSQYARLIMRAIGTDATVVSVYPVNNGALKGILRAGRKRGKVKR